MAGNGIGVLSMLGLDTGFQVYFSVTIVSVLVATMVRVYENRWYLLTRNRKLWRKLRGPLCNTNYIICITFFIPFLFFVPDQTEAVPEILKKVPCYHLYTQNVPLYVFTLNPIPPIITVAVFSIVQIGLMTLFISLTVRVLTYQARRNTTSQYTISLHRRFLYALIAQTGLPVIVVFCPLLSLFYLIPMGYHNQRCTGMGGGFSGTPSAGIVSGGCLDLPPRPRPFEFPDIFGGGNSGQEKIIAELRKELRECRNELKKVQSQLEAMRREKDEQADRIRRDALEERRQAREANERMIKNMQSKIDESQRKHDDEISKIKLEYDQKVKQVQDENSKQSKQLEKEHKRQMKNLQATHDATLSKLDEKLETVKREGQEKIKEMTDKNEQIASQQVEQLLKYQEKLKKLEADHQTKVSKVKMLHRQLQEKIVESEKKQRQLGEKLKLEAAEQMNSELSRQISQNDNREVLKEFMSIMKTMENAETGLRRINSLCSSKLSEKEESDAELNVQTLAGSESTLTNQVFQFRQIIINRQNVNKELLRICQDYVRAFEKSLKSKKFMLLCTKLPSAIETKNQSEITELGRMAGELSEELEEKRGQITGELEHIQNPQPQIQ
ncbi:unnamed protein product [Caenorhabditis nigoni]